MNLTDPHPRLLTQRLLSIALRHAQRYEALLDTEPDAATLSPESRLLAASIRAYSACAKASESDYPSRPSKPPSNTVTNDHGDEVDLSVKPELSLDTTAPIPHGAEHFDEPSPMQRSLDQLALYYTHKRQNPRHQKRHRERHRERRRGS